jgi:NADH:ubiquinone reductase (H+-translocating)
MAEILHRDRDQIVGRPNPRSETATLRPGETALHRVVVVGGGAAGLELVTRLGYRLGRRLRASVTLVECARTHL